MGLSPDNRITRIQRPESRPARSTGRKYPLSVVYAEQGPGLHDDPFVKFSRDFDDAFRDWARVQMERERRFALPIAVPDCYYADYHRASGTGILIRRRIRYGERGIERHFQKCLDHTMPDPPGHYAALVRCLGLLAGAQRGEGRAAVGPVHVRLDQAQRQRRLAARSWTCADASTPWLP